MAFDRFCRLRIAACLLFALAVPASAADILSAAYDARADEIVVGIAYRGTNPHHDFRVEWGACKNAGVVGRLVDEQGGDAARSDYRVTERLSLRGLPCRPSVVTLRLGRIAHASVRVPERQLAADK